MTAPWPAAALVVGARRGLGEALVTELWAQGVSVVVGTRRDAAADGDAIPLDYRDPASITAAADAVRRRVTHLDLIVNCGAVNVVPGFPKQSAKGPLAELHPDALAELLATNVVGPVMASAAFLPMLADGGVLVNVSTSRASLALATDPGSFGYAVSKAALNMATRKIAAELELRGRAAVAVDPGWVRTDMGGADAPVSPADAASSIVSLVVRERTRLNGRFVAADGSAVPW